MGLNLDIQLNPTTSQTLKVKYISDGRPVNSVRLNHAGKEVPWNCEKAIAFGPKGEEVFLPVDIPYLNGLFPSDGQMSVIAKLPLDSISLGSLKGEHYFIQPQNGKSKRGPTEDTIALYQVVYYGLLQANEVLVVKYNSSYNYNVAVIWADDDGLILSKLKLTTLVRDRPCTVVGKEVEDAADMLNVMLEDVPTKLNPVDLLDHKELAKQKHFDMVISSYQSGNTFKPNSHKPGKKKSAKCVVKGLTAIEKLRQRTVGKAAKACMFAGSKQTAGLRTSGGAGSGSGAGHGKPKKPARKQAFAKSIERIMATA